MTFMLPPYDLHIVIPVFNGWSQTRLCLYSLRNSTFKFVHIIVVDHGSTDETAVSLAAEFPEVVRITGSNYLWWAGATNLGISQALASAASHIMLLNNDCYMSPDAIEKLIQHSQECGDNCIVAPIAKDQLTGKVLNLGYATCLWLGFPSIRIPMGLSQKNLESRKLVPTQLIMGGRGVIIPATVFRKTGLLDEANLPHYLADHDFYLRCKAAGVRLMIATDAHLYVDNTRTTIADNLSSMAFSTFRETLSGRKSHRNFKDLSAFFKKHYPIKKLYPLGVGMNVTRYFLIYTLARFFHICTKGLRHK